MARIAGGLALVLTATLAGPAAAQQDFGKVEVTSERVAEDLYMLKGAGGNVGVSVGPDGVFLVDDQYAPLTPKIKAAVAALSDKPIRFVLNTHWHGDHTGGNENLGTADTLIVAHDNVRVRMSQEQFNAVFDSRTPAAPAAALPVVTFNDTVSIHVNGADIQAFHVAPAHTDGDSVVHFRKANAIHAGDLFFNGMYPFIDTSSGGSTSGMIAAADRILALAGDQTRIIPGHGPLAGKADLREFRDMLAAVRDRVAAHVKAGRTLEEVVAAKPTAEFDAKFGGGFFKPEQFVSLVYRDLARAAGK